MKPIEFLVTLLVSLIGGFGTALLIEIKRRNHPMTNGDRIRQMSNEELAEVFEGDCNYCIFSGDLGGCNNESCIAGIKAYLESEVEE